MVNYNILRFCLFEMDVSVFFVIRCLNSAVSLTLVREQCFIRIIIIIVSYGFIRLTNFTTDVLWCPKSRQRVKQLQFSVTAKTAVSFPDDGVNVLLPWQLINNSYTSITSKSLFFKLVTAQLVTPQLQASLSFSNWSQLNNSYTSNV